MVHMFRGTNDRPVRRSSSRTRGARMGGVKPSVREHWFWLGVVGYLAVVAVTAVITGPTVIRGVDGLEIMPLGLLGIPCSVLLMFVGGWGMLPFGDSASDWGGLIGLVAGSVVNVVVIAHARMSRRAHHARTT